MDAYEAFWRSRKHSSKGDVIWGIATIAGGAILLLSGYLIGWGLIVAGAILAAIVPLRYLLHKRAYRENPTFAGLTVAKFDERLIAVENPNGNSQLNWSIYERAMESDSYFMPMISKRSFSIIPKRSFTSEAEMNSFRDLLESKLGPVVKI